MTGKLITQVPRHFLLKVDQFEQVSRAEHQRGIRETVHVSIDRLMTDGKAQAL